MKEQEIPMLTWDAAVQAMKDEGFGFQVAAGWPSGVKSSIAWRISDGLPVNPRLVKSTLTDPTAAINDLLTKARERWPAKHPWDDLGLEQLFAVCEQKRWHPHVAVRGGEGRCWVGSAGIGFPNSHYGEKEFKTPAAALLDAMKAREAAGR